MPTARRARGLMALVLVAAGLIAVGAGGQGGDAETVYVNVLQGKEISCTSDGADFEVHIYLGGEKVAESREITHDDWPVWGQVLEIEAVPGDQIGFRVSEGESGLFSHWRYDCDLGSDGDRQANVTYDGTRASHTLEGTGGNATRIQVTIGPEVPDSPHLEVHNVTTASAELSWTANGTTPEPVEHRLRKGWQGESFDTVGGGTTAFTWSDRRDNTGYTVQVLAERGPWLLGSNSVSFETENAPPPAPQLRNLAWTSTNLSLEWANVGLHDGDRVEFHTVAVANQTLDDTTNRSQQAYRELVIDRWADHRLAVPSSDRFLVARAVDTAGATNASAPVRLPDRTPNVTQAHTNGDGATVAWTHALTDLDRFDIHAGADRSFSPGPDTRVHRHVDELSRASLEVEGLGLEPEDRFVKVRAVHDDGTTRASEALEVTRNPPPAAPHNVSAIEQDGRLHLRFELVPAEDLERLTVLAASHPEATSFNPVETISLVENPHVREAIVEQGPGAIQLRVTDDASQGSTSKPVEVQTTSSGTDAQTVDQPASTETSDPDAQPSDPKDPSLSTPETESSAPEQPEGSTGGVPLWSIVTAVGIATVVGVLVGYGLRGGG